MTEGADTVPDSAEEPGDGQVTEPLEPVSAEAGETPSRPRVTPRALAVWAAVVLTIVLGVIVFFLFRTVRDGNGADPGRPLYGLESVLEIGGPGQGARPRFSRPMGVATGPEGRLYVADTGNNRVVVFSRLGRYLFEFGEFGVAKPTAGGEYTWKPGRLNYPTGIDVDEQGNIYVADFRNDQIQVFDPKGKFVRRFPDPAKRAGKGGSGQDGTGIAVTDVCVSGDRVYATDSFQVFVFDTKGALLRQFGRPGNAPGELDHPNGIAVGADGTIYVSDSNHNRVTAFSPEGAPLWNAGAPIDFAATEGNDGLGLPRGMTVDRDGTVLVADAFNFEVVRLSPAGVVLDRLGTRGSMPSELNFPNDVDTDGEILVVADRGNERVQVVRVVEKAPAAK